MESFGEDGGWMDGVGGAKVNLAQDGVIAVTLRVENKMASAEVVVGKDGFGCELKSNGEGKLERVDFRFVSTHKTVHCGQSDGKQMDWWREKQSLKLSNEDLQQLSSHF